MYKIKVIEIIEPLNTASGKPWFRYIISNEQNTITGYRSGSKNDVRRFANNCIASLNRKYPPVKRRNVNPVRVNVSYLAQITHGVHR